MSGIYSKQDCNVLALTEWIVLRFLFFIVITNHGFFLFSVFVKQTRKKKRWYSKNLLGDGRIKAVLVFTNDYFLLLDTHFKNIVQCAKYSISIYLFSYLKTSIGFYAPGCEIFCPACLSVCYHPIP